MRLCFGSFAKTVKKSLKPPKTNVRVVELLFGLVTDNLTIKNKMGQDYVVGDSFASNLLNCKRQIPKTISAASYNPEIISAADSFFEDVVLPEIEPSFFNDLIYGIRNLINGDPEISDRQRKVFLQKADKEHIAAFLAQVYLYALKKDNKSSMLDEAAKYDSQIKQALEDMDQLEQLLKSYPPPSTTSPPDTLSEDELEYVHALLDVYAEELGMDKQISIEDLDQYPDYKKDLCQHRKNYYAAEAIREGTKDCFGDYEENHFSALKEEIYDHIYSTYKKHFPSSMERLIEVMERAALSPIERCRLLSKLNWISSREKKGVCHFLVKDGEISWTEK